jgi:hypothetical protein
MAFPRRRALLGGVALTASTAAALGGAACAPPVGPRAVTAAEIYVGLARERAIAIVDTATDRVKRRISLASLGRTGITGQIAVGPTGDAAVLPLLGAARDVGVVQQTDAAPPAHSSRRSALTAVGGLTRGTGGDDETNMANVRCARVQVSTSPGPDSHDPRQPASVADGAQGLTTDARGRAYVLVGDAIGAEASSVAVIDLESGEIERRLAIAAPGERVLALQAQPDGARLFASIWRRPAHDARGNLIPGVGRLVALDAGTGRVLAQAAAPEGLAMLHLAVAAPPPGVGAGAVPAAAAPLSPVGTTPAAPNPVAAATTVYAAVASGLPLYPDDEWLGSFDRRCMIVAYDSAYLDTQQEWQLDDRPAAMVVHPDGRRAYLLAGSSWGNSFARNLAQMDFDSGAVTTWPLPYGCLALAIGPTDKVYVADTFGDRLWRLDPDSGAGLTYIPLAGAPITIASRPA